MAEPVIGSLDMKLTVAKASRKPAKTACGRMILPLRIWLLAMNQ